MNDLSLIRKEARTSYLSSAVTAPEYDDDDDAADDDYDDDYDDDEAEGIASRHERWSARPGFGSPEWWTGW